MAWVSSHPVLNAFASLCVQNGEKCSLNNDCLGILEEILRNLYTEDSTTRSFRRSLGSGQNVRKYLIPLLQHVKVEKKIIEATKIIDTTIKILVNLTIPVEYLLPAETMFQSDVGKETACDLNRVLTASKEAFVDSRSTKAIVDHMKYIVESESPLNIEQCDTINSCLLLLRNILHIPENKSPSSNCIPGHSSIQNQIIWNLFTQSIDKIIIYLMSCPQKIYWGVTIVQLIALMYKDQHVGTLQKLLNLWLESSYSESSEDNESNTSPPDQGSDDSSPVITSDPTSDSSDNGVNDRNQHNNANNSKVMIKLKGEKEHLSDSGLIMANNASDRTKTTPNENIRVNQNRNKITTMKRNKSTETENSSSGISSMGQSTESYDGSSQSMNQPPNTIRTTQTINKKNASMRRFSQSEISDCGYGTQVENQEFISTSSNDDDQPHQKPVHQKPHAFQKTRYTTAKNRATTALEKKELRRKKLVKRSRTNIIHMKGLMHHLPTDEDISNILKEFTVDFLLKGYGSLVHDLHIQLLTNVHLQIDTSHFFWLVTYFLKFATQLELDLDHISPVLSYDILSYLVFQGVWIYEELEISCSIPDIDLKPCLRRLHLVVTAIREFLQGVETYQKMIHLSDTDRHNLTKLQSKIGDTEDLKMLFILLLRQYNPNIQTRQYLQDLILTNHSFLLFLDHNSTSQGRTFNMVEHLKHFASVEVMKQYGILLESFKENGEFVNNCIFTMMHHIGGDLKNVSTLFQPNILKTFSKIWETDYEICDDWSDLIEYVIHKFINTPSKHCAEVTVQNYREKFDETETLSHDNGISECSSLDEILILFRWTREEKDNLLKYYNQSKASSDTIAKITEKYEESGMRYKTPFSILGELLEQNIITEDEYNDLLRNNSIYRRDSSVEEEKCEYPFEEDQKTIEHLDSDIKVLKEYLYKENKGRYLIWLQNILLELCHVKVKGSSESIIEDEESIMEPTVYYYSLLNMPIPVIPWTVEEANIMKHQPFVLILHKLGFYLPSETGKIFIRIPNFWTAEHIFSIAQQLGPINPDKIKFDINKFKARSDCNVLETRRSRSSSLPESGKFSMTDLKQTPYLMRYTPLPNSSEWFQNVLRTRISPVVDNYPQTPSTRRLSISIPESDLISCDIPVPELAIVNRDLLRKDFPVNMECSQLNDNDTLIDELEKNSNSDTASVASDLTRMCVSDEEDKVIDDGDRKTYNKSFDDA